MTKEQFDIFTTKTNAYLKKAKLFYKLFILIFVVLFISMFIYTVVSPFMNFIMILTIMALLYQFVFKEYIYYARKYIEYKRISYHKQFKLSDEVVDFFDKDVFQKLYDLDYELAVKNDVYVIASKAIKDSIYTLALAVYFNDLETDAVSASPKGLSNELTGYILKPSIIKVILLISNDFSEGEVDYLKYSSVFHKNTVVIGLEKNTNTLYYNYFLNGSELDNHLSEIFKVDLNLMNSSVDEEV
jgi:hypothetical protein